MNRQQRGFTLIEVLVVVSILGVLMGLVTILVVKSAGKKKEMLTEQVVRTILPVAIDKYKLEFKVMPPMSIKELAQGRWKGLTIAQNNSTNECSECLLVALRHPDFSSPVGDDMGGMDKPFGNTDDDIWNKTPDGSPGPEAREILDAYGNPVVYIHKNRYSDPVLIVNHLGEEVEVSAVRKPNGQFYNPNRYQVISVGENGVQDDASEPDFMDDIMNFSLDRGE